MQIETSSGIKAEVELLNTHTSEKIFNNLPIKGKIQTWGDEIYFKIPVELEEESNAKEIVDEGDVAYWPAGNAFCIFFGPTPMSTDEKPVAAGAVNVFGKIKDDYSKFEKVKNGESITIYP